MNLISLLRRQVELMVPRLLSEQDRNPYSMTYGCFDRRFWGWKLVDFPEATFQRNVYPLAMIYTDPASSFYQSDLLGPAIKAGLVYASKIQHKNGSFDQAFPNEQSFGATAFLLHPLLEAFKVVELYLTPIEQQIIQTTLRKAAHFLCRQDERHGHIANHLAGAALSLLVAARHFHEEKFEQRALLFLERILAHQSKEGWFLEYEGADPGYQTLCLYYLAQIYEIKPTPKLEKALGRALEFIQWFVHPDGTFGGVYGSRRTAIFYPGGLALLGKKYPQARAIYWALLKAITCGQTISLFTIDMGNLAPLFSNYVCALKADLALDEKDLPLLPRDLLTVEQDFTEAGLYLRGTTHYYAIIGASNGGTLKVFDRRKKRLKWDDGGYVGQLTNGTLLTTQITNHESIPQANQQMITIETPFYRLLGSLPSPSRFIVLRLINMTLMRNIELGNWLKQHLVKLLISGKQSYPLRLKRKLTFETDHIIVEDTLSNPRQLSLRWLEYGRSFNGIHMASAGYYEGAQEKLEKTSPNLIDVERLQQEKSVTIKTVI